MANCRDCVPYWSLSSRLYANSPAFRRNGQGPSSRPRRSPLLTCLSWSQHGCVGLPASYLSSMVVCYSVTLRTRIRTLIYFDDLSGDDRVGGSCCSTTGSPTSRGCKYVIPAPTRTERNSVTTSCFGKDSAFLIFRIARGQTPFCPMGHGYC